MWPLPPELQELRLFRLLENQSQLSCEQHPQPDVEEKGVEAEVVFLFSLDPVLQLGLIFEVKPGSTHFPEPATNYQRQVRF